MSKPDKGKLHRALERAQLKITEPRLAILRSLYKTPRTVRELHTVLGGKVHQATLYRALPELVKRGVLTEIDFPGPETRYEFSEHHHHHVVCRDCGTVEGVTICIPPATLKRVLATSRQFSAIHEHSLEFLGVCRRCAPSPKMTSY